MGISSSCATRMALAFSVIVPTAANPSEDMLMEMVSEIDVAEGRSSSDLIKAAIVAMGLRAGWRVFVVVLVGGALDVEVVRPRSRAVAFFAAVVAAVGSTSHWRRLLLHALLAALVPGLLLPPSLGLDLLYEPAEIRFQEALVRVPTLQ